MKRASRCPRSAAATSSRSRICSSRSRSSRPGIRTSEVEKALIAEFDKLRTEPISERELQRAKNQFFRDYIVDRESIRGKASQLAHAVVIHERRHDGRRRSGDLHEHEGVRPASRREDVFHAREPPRAEDSSERDALMMRRAFLASILALVDRLRLGCGAQVASWPSENPPRPLPSRPVSFPPYELRTLPNGMQVIVVMHHEQPEVTMRLLVRAGAAYDPPGKGGTASLVGSLLNQGTTTRSARRDCRCDRFDRRRARHRRRQRRDVGDRSRHERQLRRRHEHARRRHPTAGVCARRNRAPAHADDSEPRRQPRGSGFHRARGAQPPDLRVSSVRIPRQRHAGHDREDHARGSSRVPSPVFRAEQQHPRHRRRRGRGRSDGRRDARVRRLAEAGRAAAAAAGTAAADAAHCRHRQARLGADGRARRPARHSAQDARLHEHGPGDPHSRRRGQQPAVPRAPFRARPHIFGVGRFEPDAPGRRHHRRDRHAHRGHGRGRARHRRRVHAPSARAHRRRRARGRAGVHDRQLSADDRNAGRDRAPGGERRLLRPVARRAAHLPPARECRDAGRCPARGAHLHPARSTVDCDGRRCREVQGPARQGGVRQLRADFPRAQLDLTAADFKKR